MKFVLAAVLALALSARASIVPHTVYGLPETTVTEFKPVVPAPIYGVPEEHHAVEVLPAAIAPATPSVTIKGPSTYTTVVGPVDHAAPHFYSHPYSSLYPYHTGFTPSLYSGYQPSLGFSSLSYGYAASHYNQYAYAAPHYAYSAPHYAYTAPHYAYAAPHYAYAAPQIAYEAPKPTVNIVGPQVSYVQPGSVTTVVNGAEEHVAEVVNHDEVIAVKEPVVTNYEYQLPQVVVPEKVVVAEVTKPIVPHTTYGLPYQ